MEVLVIRKSVVVLLSGALTLAGLVVAPPALAGDCSQIVDVQVDQDACAGVVAVSLTRDAQARGAPALSAASR